MKKALVWILLFAVLFTSAACFEKEHIYAVSFDLDGGELVSGELIQQVAEGQAAAAPELTREGYAFDGWDKAFDAVMSDMTVTAIWKKLYTISFDAGEGAVLNGEAELLVAEGDMPESPTPEMDGYVFSGWEPEVVPVAADAVYSAVWEEKVYTAQEIYDRISPAVVEIEVWDKSGSSIGLGSGFFIDDKGTIVTNYHVMEGAYTARVTMPDGKDHRVDYIIDYDEKHDLALIHSNVSSTEYLQLSDKPVYTGQVVYAMGSSLGLTGTFSNGIVSNAEREVEGVNCIQITAPISSGNSGGPLVNDNAKVVGINSMSMTSGQNLNFAINISELDRLDRGGRISMQSFGDATTKVQNDEPDYTQGFYPTADLIEEEINDILLLADALENGDVIAAELADDDDYDYFGTYVDGPCELYAEVLPFNRSDRSKVFCWLVKMDENGELSVVTELDVHPGSDAKSCTLTVAEAGYYFIAVYAYEEAKPDYPIYYCAKFVW